ncbi:type II secretion system F family protein [Roseibium sediminis]|uniref:type II secretion system F family protein n=1 Tax=Roseibium sediminis TaxID=1775174 RepID=UPI00123CCAE5|nr:type II secretion system F family protein [Roseibium sediminis]
MENLDTVMTSEMTTVAVMLLVAFSIGGILFAFLQPSMSANKRRNERMSSVSRRSVGSASLAKVNKDADRRRKTVKDQLDQLDQKTQQKTELRTKPSLRLRIEQAGLSWSLKRFWQISIGCGFVSAVLLMIITGNAIIALAGGFSGAFGLPRFYINSKRKRRFNDFLDELPNAVDIIVRGVKAGLPLADCVRVVSNEARAPVSTEFAKIVEAQKVGISMGEAFMKLPERVPLPEANFFAIVVSVQQSSGGALSEALANLSRVLRGRKSLKRKIVALSSEAKSSAMIIGALPVLVSGAIHLLAPNYMEPLFSTLNGNLILAGALGWMLTGVLVMRQMINFDF